MNTRLRKFLDENTVSAEELAQDLTVEEKLLVEQEIRYYDTLQAVRKLRKTLDLTQQQLAEKAGLPRTTVTKIESGSYNPTINTLMSLAAAMGKKLKIELV